MSVPGETFALVHPLRVRWTEVDPQGVVFNGHYLAYADVGLTEYWRELSAAAGKDLGTYAHQLYVVKAELRYKHSARYDQLLHVGVRAGRLGNTSVTFMFRVVHGDTVCVEAELVYAYVPAGADRAAPLPDDLRDAIRRFEKVAPTG